MNAWVELTTWAKASFKCVEFSMATGKEVLSYPGDHMCFDQHWVDDKAS